MPFRIVAHVVEVSYIDFLLFIVNFFRFQDVRHPIAFFPFGRRIERRRTFAVSPKIYKAAVCMPELHRPFLAARRDLEHVRNGPVDEESVHWTVSVQFDDQTCSILW